MGRITDDIHRAVSASVQAAQSGAPGPPAAAPGGAGGDFRSWPVTVGLLLALGGSVGALVSWVRSTDAQQRAVAGEAIAGHDGSSMAHTDIRARLAGELDRQHAMIADLRERLRVLEARAVRPQRER